MTPQAEERHLNDGTHLVLYRNITGTMQDKSRVAGDWLIVQEVNHPRAVVFVAEFEGKLTAKMIYDTHTLENRGRPEPPPPEKLNYVFYNIDSKDQEEKYLNLRKHFDH